MSEAMIATNAATLMPALSVKQAVERYQLLTEFVKTLLKPETDFGAIPGTTKPTLLKPGAEKLLTFFGLTKRFAILERVEDWTGSDHGGEAFFYYLYRCALYYGDQLIAESDGSCNSFESKYRYRKAERQCPECGRAAIIKGRAEYGGGWLCFKKKDGCGAKFEDGDSVIESQEVGRIANPDVADLVNTLQKMAQKRALIAATLLAVNASEFFTQDMEDLVENGSPSAEREPEPETKKRKPRAKGEAGQILALAEGLGWSEEQLADEIHRRTGFSITADTLADGIAEIPPADQQAIIQALKLEFEARKQATNKRGASR